HTLTHTHHSSTLLWPERSVPVSPRLRSAGLHTPTNTHTDRERWKEREREREREEDREKIGERLREGERWRKREREIQVIHRNQRAPFMWPFSVSACHSLQPQ